MTTDYPRGSFLLPLRREDGLVVRDLPDETLIYDRTRNKAHCLNRAAALVWQHCDGRMSVAKMAELMQVELSIAADEPFVWLALDRLQRAGLLERPPAVAGTVRYSRRDLARKLGIAALAVPLVLTVMAPTAAAAASCARSGRNCVAPARPCCPGCVCAGNFCQGNC
jgi:hypothetical protein